MRRKSLVQSGNDAVGWAEDGDPWRSVTVPFSRICKPDWRPLPVAILSRLCFGPAKAPVISPRPWCNKATT